MTVQVERGVDPVTLEVIRNALPAISDEMSFDLQRTSYNMMIYEVRDYCTALIGADGSLLSQNIGGVSHFVSDLGVVVLDGIRQYGTEGFAPGDVIIHNHQKVAGQHLNNVCVYTPLFWEGRLVAFPMVRAHWVDVGILSTGFGAGNAFDPWSEGIQFDQIKLYEAGEPDRKALQFIHDNIRFPENGMGDLRSQIAACKLAERRYTELLRRYGLETMTRAIEAIYDETERKCRAVVAKMPDGVYEAESLMDRRPGLKPTEIRVKVTIKGGDMTIDLSGCSPATQEGPASRTHAAAYIAYKALTTPLEPVNEGSFRALEAIIPEGNMMMAPFPQVPISNWSGMLPTVVDTIWLALAKAMPDRIPAAHHASLGGFAGFMGEDKRRKKRFVLQSIEGGGWGGRPNEDGEDASVSLCQGDVRNTPIETMELKLPVMVVERALRPGSGGPGKNRGGLGLIMHVRTLQEGRWNLAQGGGAGRQSCPPWGLLGGKPGVVAQRVIKRPGSAEWVAGGVQEANWAAGLEVKLQNGGGAGWGDPLDREPARVRRDAIEGYVSGESARKDYGVVLSADGRTVDDAATAKLRAEMRKG